MGGRGRGGSAGNKFRMTLALPVGAVMNCADNSGAKNLYVSHPLSLCSPETVEGGLTAPEYRSSPSPVRVPASTVSRLLPLAVRHERVSARRAQARERTLTGYIRILQPTATSNRPLFSTPPPARSRHAIHDHDSTSARDCVGLGWDVQTWSWLRSRRESPT